MEVIHAPVRRCPPGGSTRYEPRHIYVVRSWGYTATIRGADGIGHYGRNPLHASRSMESSVAVEDSANMREPDIC